MSTGSSVAHAIASLAHSEISSPQDHPSEKLALEHSYQHPHDKQDAISRTRHYQQINIAASNAAVVLTSVARAGGLTAGATAPKKRSTKSKCSPGLRSGKWTPEEEAFTNMLIHYFKRGFLDVEDGTSLRWYLAKRLNCEAMRVTKKLKGNSSIGKQVFRAIENNATNRQAIRRAREELAVLEARFLESLNAGGIGPGTQHVPAAPLPSSLAVSVRGRKILPNTKLGCESNHLTIGPMPQPKSEDARLLMYFFCEAHDTNSEEEPEAEKKVENKAEPGSLSVDLSGKLGKKRSISSVSNVTDHDAVKTVKALEKHHSSRRQTHKTEKLTE
ncbi:hypothetical protein PsorP6_008804 [Peronosclerospora sorghi]|uniref:Uncharacterized protein n=1 Tax=Peronosclerospora sorghi TaxID=230839 RepID=A0ACC0W1Z0_9STRA|nr:hypothetical protein PsorP6_008804 [Peronosclerospora sorghi]